MNDSKFGQLSKAQFRELTKLVDSKYSIIRDERLRQFLSSYIDCESSARKLVNYHRALIGQKVLVGKDKLQYPMIYNAARYYLLNITRDEVAHIFRSGNGKRNNMTLRELRNAFINNKSPNDAIEIISRNRDLTKLMKVWLNAINTAK